MKSIADDAMALTAVKVLKEYLEDRANEHECGEGYWTHKDGDTFNIDLSSFNDGLINIDKFLQKRIDSAVLQNPTMWIPISEGLPEEGETVIASTEYGVYGEARYTKEYGWEWLYDASGDYWKELEGVTAWMPSPKLYEPHESEEEK